jgi:hypothetical protein
MGVLAVHEAQGMVSFEGLAGLLEGLTGGRRRAETDPSLEA